MYLHGNILTVVWVQIPSEESSNLQADEPLRYWSTLRYWKGAVWSRWPEPEDVWFSKLYSSLEFFGASSLLLSHKYNHFPHLLMLSLKCLSFFKKNISLALLDLPCSMWDLVPWQGMSPGPLHQEYEVLATGPPGESLKCLLILSHSLCP